MINKKLLIVCFLFSFYHSSAQDAVYEFKIANTDNKESIPFVQAWFINHEDGLCSNEYGQGKLVLTQDKCRQLKDDSLVIQALSYKRQIIKFSDLKLNQLNYIELIPQAIQLEEITISSRKKVKTSKLGNTKTDYLLRIFPISNYGTVGWIIGRYIPNTTESNPYIKSVSYYITNWGKYQAPFRVRIFSVNDSLFPKNDLLTSNVIAKAQKPNKWVTADISKYNIKLPDSGVIVFMEWIWTGDQHYFTPKFQENQAYGATLGFSSNEQDYYRRGRYNLGFVWQKSLSSYFKESNSDKKITYNDPCIYLEIEKIRKKRFVKSP